MAMSSDFPSFKEVLAMLLDNSILKNTDQQSPFKPQLFFNELRSIQAQLK